MRPKIKDATKVTLSMERSVKEIARALAEARNTTMTGLIEDLILASARTRQSNQAKQVPAPVIGAVPGRAATKPEEEHIPPTSYPPAYEGHVLLVRAGKTPVFPPASHPFKKGAVLVAVEAEPRPGDLVVLRDGDGRISLCEMNNVGERCAVFDDEPMESAEPVAVVWSVLASAGKGNRAT